MHANIAKKHDINDRIFAHLTLILFLHYLVKCRSETRKSVKICYLFNINQEQVYRTKMERTETTLILKSVYISQTRSKMYVGTVF